MTVSTTTVRDQYTGTGANTVLPTTFAFNESSEVVVISRVTATGVETTLVESTHYTVSGGNWNIGAVTPIDGATDFPVTVTWTLQRDTPLTQETDYVENDEFSADSHENALDKLTFITQEREDRLDRSIQFPASDDTALSAELPSSVDRASNFLAFDANGEPIASPGVTPDEVVVSAYMETVLDDADADAARTTLEAQEDVITTQGDLVVGDATPEASRLAVGAEGEYLRSDGTGPSWEPLDYKENLLINGNFSVWQRGTAFDSTTTPANSDDTYLMDRWILLSDGNDRVDISRETTIVPEGSLYSVKLYVKTVGSPSEKFALCQIIEQVNCIGVIGKEVSLSFQARTTSGAVENLRAAVLSWDGAADTVTSDVVNAWAAEDTNPTWAANWTAENTATNLALSDTFQTFTIENIAIDTSGAVNIALIIWVDDTDLVATNVVYIADVELVPGTSIGVPRIRTFNQELALSKRYFQKTFPYAVAPVQNVGDYIGALEALGNDSGTSFWEWDLSEEMRATPTVTTFNPKGANALPYNHTDTSDATAATVLASTRSIHIEATDASEANDAVVINATAEIEL